MSGGALQSGWLPPASPFTQIGRSIAIAGLPLSIIAIPCDHCLDTDISLVFDQIAKAESVMAAAVAGWMDIANSESPEFIGRVIAALNNAPQTPLDRLSGHVVVAAQLATDLGVCDVDGQQPVPLTLETL